MEKGGAGTTDPDPLQRGQIQSRKAGGDGSTGKRKAERENVENKDLKELWKISQGYRARWQTRMAENSVAWESKGQIGGGRAEEDTADMEKGYRE